MSGFTVSMDAGSNAIVRLRRGESAKTQKAQVKINNSLVKTLNEDEHFVISAVSLNRTLEITPISFRAGQPRGPSRWKYLREPQTFPYWSGGTQWIIRQFYMKIEDRTDDEDWDDGYIDVEITRRLADDFDEEQLRTDPTFVENGEPLFSLGDG